MSQQECLESTWSVRIAILTGVPRPTFPGSGIEQIEVRRKCEAMTETIIKNRLDEYIGEIAAQRRIGAATEHSYRPALQRLLADAIPRATIVNEPARIE